MEQVVNQEEPFNLEDQRYTFTKSGTAKEAEFHLWRVTQGQSDDSIHKYKYKDMEEEK